MSSLAEPTFIEFIRYNNWANAQVLQACQHLTDDQRRTAAPGAYGSVHATLGHLIAAEADYVDRLTGQAPQPPFRWEDQPSIPEISAFAPLVAAALLDMARRVPPTYIVHEEEDGDTLDYQARALFIQIINHGIEHRTNITTILSGLGLDTPEIDGWSYLFSHGDDFALKETFKNRPNAAD